MALSSQTRTNELLENCLNGGGEMGALMRSLDWSATALGQLSGWPPSLKMALGILLASGYPMYIAWGPEFIQFYNDAYRPILGANKHPKALGQRTSECFAEIWDFIGPMFRRAATTGEATTLVDQLLALDRNGYVEECYFTFSYSAIPEVTGGYGGVFVTVIETTHRVLSERRISTLRELAASAAQARTTEHASALIAAALGRNTHDLPFTLLYLVDATGTRARLMGTSGLEADAAVSPATISPDEQEIWPFGTVKHTNGRVVVTDLQDRFGRLPGGAWPEAPRSAVVLPLTQPGPEPLAGFLIAGISPRLMLDDAYQGYLDLVAGSVATVLGSARAYELERERAEALAELDRAKTTFFSNVSHEFRTPLTLVLGQLEDMLARPEDDLPPGYRDALEAAHRNALRLLKLVNTLLDFSRIEAGRIQAVYEPTDLSAYTAELASLFRSAIEKAGMRLIVSCAPLSQPVYVDQEMWEKIVFNLLSNAFKFTETGEIEVRLDETGSRVELSVRDTGAGIQTAQLPHIFERFHRVEGARARTYEGTGIGLALVQELVRLHGGEVRVASVYGEGSTFTVSLPYGTSHLPKERIRSERSPLRAAVSASPYVLEALRSLPDSEQATAVPPLISEDTSISTDPDRIRQASRARSRIVLADDNADMRAYVSGLLAPFYEVLAVPDGVAALHVIQERLPDLVLSDVMMPGLDGFELLHALRADAGTRTLPVILLSARAGEEARVEGLAAHADDYLTKPFSARELLARVAAHLEMAQIRREAEQTLRERQVEIEALNARLKRAMTETHHRVKNNLQVISAMIEMQAMEHNADNLVPVEVFRQLKAHVYTLSIVHDLLTKGVREEEDDQRISAKAVLDRLLPMLEQTAWNKAVTYRIEEARLTSKRCVALALILNELVSNALKHGRNEANIVFRTDGSSAVLEVSDDGSGFSQGFDPITSANMGLELVESLVHTDLKGRSTYSNRPRGGGQVTITFPLPADES